jgi:hypothetical protein
MLLNTLLFSAVAFGTSAHAAAAAYAQCGGQGFTGATTCVSGYSCVVSNAYYSQCLPGANTARPVSSTKTSVAPVSTSKAAGGGGSGGSSGTTYKASFTQYGSGDTFGSGNCNTDTTACGFYTNVSNFPHPHPKPTTNPQNPARLLRRPLPKRLRRRPRSRRRTRLRHLLETDRQHRQQRQQVIQRRQQHRRPSHQPLPRLWKPSVQPERPGRNQPIRC